MTDRDNPIWCKARRLEEDSFASDPQVVIAVGNNHGRGDRQQ